MSADSNTNAGDQRFLNELECQVEGLVYDFVGRRGRLSMPRGNCCDMAGCIELFERIDPKVEHTITHAGDRKDTSYHRRPPNEWHVTTYVYDRK